MKKHGLLIVLLILALLATGCQTETAQPQGSSPNSLVVPNATRPEDIEPTVEYGWTDGESPVPIKRIGVVRAGTNLTPHAVSPSGVYFFDTSGGDNTFIIYADDGTDTFIKLCGRPDCTHDNSDCNAYIFSGKALSYYGGYLYAASGNTADSLEARLIRMNPDGSNHVTVMDLTKFAKENGGDYAKCDIITDGFCLFSVYGWKIISEDGDSTESVSSHKGYYYYKLDGSMEAPERAEVNGLACYSCGDVFLVHNPNPVEGSRYGSYYNWNPDTNCTTFLTHHPGEPGWYGENEGYYFQDGYIYRLTYATRKTEPMVDTGLEGYYYLFAFPDCIVLASNEQHATDNNLYFYNWSFELLDTVHIPNPNSTRTNFLLIAETADRFILTTSLEGMPKSYICKSELGTGNLELHEFIYA